MSNSIGAGLPVLYEGGLGLTGNFAGVFQEGCVCYQQVLEFYSLAAFLINLGLTRLTVTLKPASNKWKKNSNKKETMPFITY